MALIFVFYSKGFNVCLTLKTDESITTCVKTWSMCGFSWNHLLRVFQLLYTTPNQEESFWMHLFVSARQICDLIFVCLYPFRSECHINRPNFMTPTSIFVYTPFIHIIVDIYIQYYLYISAKIPLINKNYNEWILVKKLLVKIKDGFFRRNNNKAMPVSPIKMFVSLPANIFSHKSL